MQANTANEPTRVLPLCRTLSRWSLLLISIHTSLVFFLATEMPDDLIEHAARTHPDASPRLPPLPFTDHADVEDLVCTRLGTHCAIANRSYAFGYSWI